MMRLRIRPRGDLTCRQTVDLVTDYLEGALTAERRGRFEAHLTGCVDCPEYLAQMRATIALARPIAPEDLTPQMRSEFIGLYRRWHADPAAFPHTRHLPPDASGPSPGITGYGRLCRLAAIIVAGDSPAARFPACVWPDVEVIAEDGRVTGRAKGRGWPQPPGRRDGELLQAAAALSLLSSWSR